MNTDSDDEQQNPNDTSGRVTIQKGREKPIRNRHPWIFSRAIIHAEHAMPGDLVTVSDAAGDFLARGYWNPASQIQVRILTWDDEPIDEAWWARMLDRAIDARRAPHLPEACRLVNAENDYLPGLIVDRYGDWLVLQALTMGIDTRKAMIAELLAERLHPAGIYERSDVDARRKEGLNLVTGLLWGEEPPPRITVALPAGRVAVDVRQGHKTGTYLDQSANHALLGELLAQVAARQHGELPRTLNLFSYSGGFGLVAAEYGTVVNVDSSREALELAEHSLVLNGLPAERAEFIQGDVFQYLRDAVAEDRRYDVVILDPPKFAHNKQQVQRASRGYKDINLNALQVIEPGGYLLTFSCSGAIDADLFQKIVFGALADSGRQAQVVRHLGPADDHPVALTFPEGAYLKGLLLRVY